MDSNTLICLMLVVVGSCLILQTEGRCYNAHKDITCQSWGYSYATCRAPGPITYVSLKKQLSHTTCQKYANFGHHSNNVWVNHGCRAVFSVGYRKCSACQLTTRVMKCSSWGYKYKACPAPGPVRSMTVATKLSRSPCIQNRSYGYYGNTIYVNNGCRAYFRVTYAQC